MALEIKVEKDKKVSVPAYIVPLFTNVKNTSEPLIMPKTTKECMDFIVKFSEEFMKKDKNDQKRYGEPDQWEEESTEKKWFNTTIATMPMPQILVLINTSTSLGFEALSNICCYYIAQSVQEKTTAEMRAMMGIPNDFTPEEEAELAKENEWWA